MGGASDNVDPDIIEELLSMLDKNNELVKAFCMARNRFENEDLDEFKLVLISSQFSSGRPNHITPSDEVAAFIVSDDTDIGGFRDTVVNSKQEGLKRIYETDPYFMQLQYPLLFPWGTEGYHKLIPLISNKYSETENLDDEELDPDSTLRRHVSLREYYCYKIMIRTSEDWVSTHQSTIRADLYNSVRDALNKGDHDPMHVGKAVILPASFTGSQRYMSQYFKDLLAICCAIGHTSLFLTMMCNSKWPEIQEMLKLLPNIDPVDAPDIGSRVFKLKLDQLLDLIKKKNYFGKCIGIMHVIEFQKHGLPHVHMLIWLSPESRPNSVEKVDQLVSAEIADKNSDPIAYKAIKNYMMHGTYLMVIPFLTIVVFQFIGGVTLFKIVEISLQVLFEGSCTATMLLKKKSNKSGNAQTTRSVKNLNEVKNFLDGRYVCAFEASWQIFRFDIHHRSPSVDRLPIHFPGQKYLNFHSSANLENVCNNVTSKKNVNVLYLSLITIDGTTYDTFKEACGALELCFSKYHRSCSLSDIIGVIADLQPRVNIETIFGVQPLIRFNVTQGPVVSFKVDIWGALTESMTSLYEDGEETPVIIVLSSAKASLLSLILRPPISTLTREYRRFLTLGIGLRSWDMMVPIVIDELNKEERVEGGF
ncbi:uncharacterized protein LOC141713917 [Apium graveolens]|uniref:uncharacterized protein LOC141713917 n=1 Tax=Apium graveolens TaxID=4045 RepID=UPI003D7BB745